MVLTTDVNNGNIYNVRACARRRNKKGAYEKHLFVGIYIIRMLYIRIISIQPRPMVQFSHGVPRLCLRCHFGVKLTFCFTLALEIWWKITGKTVTNKYATRSVKMQKVPHLEELSSNYSKLFRVVYKGSLADAKAAENIPKNFICGDFFACYFC